MYDRVVDHDQRPIRVMCSHNLKSGIYKVEILHNWGYP